MIESLSKIEEHQHSHQQSDISGDHRGHAHTAEIDIALVADFGGDNVDIHQWNESPFRFPLEIWNFAEYSRQEIA